MGGIVDQGTRALLTVRGCLRHRSRHDRIDRGREIRPLARDVRRRQLQVCVHQARVVLRLERRTARQAFEQHASERVHVGARVRAYRPWNCSGAA